jgi:Zn-dependent M28 family amino/carboxypeptidase
VSSTPPAPERADPGVLRRHVEALEGERHSWRSPHAIRRAREYVRAELERYGWRTRIQPFRFGGAEHENILALPAELDERRPRVVIGAHLDTIRGTPGADDNASGVAGVLEAARVLSRSSTQQPVELAVWDLEERTGLTYRVGSRRHVAEARRTKVRYAGALVLEMIGYRTTAPGSQGIPLPIRWMNLPRTGDFLAVVGDLNSRRLLLDYLESAGRASPGLEIVHLTVPFRGWAVWVTRRSDNASFWSNGVPALMLTDTAELRNPHYHRATDRSSTLDYRFMAEVVDSVIETARTLQR